MKKIILFSLAILFIAGGVAFATDIPVTVDPKNYPTVWTEQIYNGSGATIVSGYIVEWDHATADSTENEFDDMCPYVQLCDAAGDVWTCGVVPYGDSIPNASTGTIIVKGPAYVYEGTNGVTANAICESDASGRAQDMDVTGNNEASIGICIQDDPDSAGPDDNCTSWCIVYVDASQHEI